jgi:transcriptional regulator with XRE-family HTH domain
MQRFGETIRRLREDKKLLLRQLAAKLDIDAAQLSKIECGERRAKREQVILMAEILNADKEELLSLWLAAKVYEMLKDEEEPQKAIKVAEKELKYLKTNRNKNG